VLKPVAVTTERNTLTDLFFYALPSVSVVHHAGDIVILVSNVVELKDTMVIQPTLLALQSLLVLQQLLSILINTFLGFSPSHS
jgi:hypothetical protein